MLTRERFEALCHLWRGCPGIVDGIIAAHRAAGGDAPSRSVIDDLFRNWGGR